MDDRDVEEDDEDDVTDAGAGDGGSTTREEEGLTNFNPSDWPLESSVDQLLFALLELTEPEFGGELDNNNDDVG